MNFIENCRREIWKFWSVRLQLAAAFLTGLMFIDPGTLLNAWNMMPGAVRQLLPDRFVQVLGVILFLLNVLTIFARGVKQPKLEKPDGTTE